MRTKQAMKNAFTSLLLQLVLAISGIVVPRFFITLYGSAVNGLVSSISQFITYINLVEAGIGAAGTVALFKPLADGDMKNTNSILSAANKFYKQSGSIFLALVGLLVLFYPFAVQDEITDGAFVREMIVVLALSGLVDYFILGKYRMLLTADQRGYIVYIAQILGTVLMTAVSIAMMSMQFSALAVKGAAAAIYILRSIAVVAYARRHYKGLDFKEKPNMSAFDQRWAALVHQITGMIVTNSAVVLLTLMVEKDALVAVSIYSTYNLVAWALTSVITAIQSGLSAGFGQIISKHEDEVLARSYSTYEYICYIFVFIVYACMGALLYPFISIYSVDFADAALYPQWSVVLCFTLSGFLGAMRMPAQTIINSAGHYRQTRSRAIVEMIINLAVSLALVRPFGIVGVLIASCVSHGYRLIDVIIYNEKYFIKGSLKTTAVRLVRNIAVIAVALTVGVMTVPSNCSSWMVWFVSAAVYGVCACVLFVGVNIIFEPSQAKATLGRIKDVLKK